MGNCLSSTTSKTEERYEVVTEQVRATRSDQNSWQNSKVQIDCTYKNKDGNIWKSTTQENNTKVANNWERSKGDPDSYLKAPDNAWKASKMEYKDLPLSAFERDHLDFSAQGNTSRQMLENGRDKFDFSVQGDPSRPHIERDRFDFSASGQDYRADAIQQRDIFDFSAKGDQTRPYWS